jgi:hypothetical protein
LRQQSRFHGADGSLRVRPTPASAGDPPSAKVNYVDHSIIDQTSILQFIEDNWNLGRIGGLSFDAVAGSLINVFEFEDGGVA